MPDETWLEVHLWIKAGTSHESLLQNFVSPVIAEVERNDWLDTFHFLREPGPRLLLRIRPKKGVPLCALETLVRRHIPKVSHLTSREPDFCHYPGEAHVFGEKGWHDTKRFFEAGCRVSLTMAQQGETDQFNSGKLVHCFLNSLGIDERAFHRFSVAERALMDGLYAMLNQFNEEERAQFSVVVYGSFMRSDFVLAKSDIDLMLITRDESHPDPGPQAERILKSRIEADGLVKADIWRLRLGEIPKKGGVNPDPQERPIQFGLYAFDVSRCHKTIHGLEYLNELDIPDPKPLALMRLRKLAAEELVRHPEQAPKWACEAIKALQIYFGNATREKTEVFEGYFRFVPEFALKEFAREVWREYSTPFYIEKMTDPNKTKYLANCAEFVRQARDLVQSL